MLAKLKFGWFYRGPSIMCGARYREIAFGLWPRKNPAEGEIAYRINFNMRWVWPRFYVQYIRD